MKCLLCSDQQLVDGWHHMLWADAVVVWEERDVDQRVLLRQGRCGHRGQTEERLLVLAEVGWRESWQKSRWAVRSRARTGSKPSDAARGVVWNKGSLIQASHALIPRGRTQPNPHQGLHNCHATQSEPELDGLRSCRQAVAGSTTHWMPADAVVRPLRVQSCRFSRQYKARGWGERIRPLPCMVLGWSRG